MARTYDTVSKDDVTMPLDPFTCIRARARSAFSCDPLSSDFFLLSGYNGQTHNKEGKTRYVGRPTMEHT